MRDYESKQLQLQKEAKEILKDLNLLAYLSKYGTPMIVGSMVLGLMTWRDIDVYVKTKPNNDDCLNVISYLFKKRKCIV